MVLHSNLLLLLLLLIPIVMQRDRILVMMGTGPEPENTVSEPEFISGAGTIEDPFILEPSKKIKAGESISSKEVITIDNMTVNNVEMIDLNQMKTTVTSSRCMKPVSMKSVSD